METAFRMVLTTSLYASIAGIIILMLKTVLKNKISPKWHYIIWIVLIVKLIIPFGPQSAVSLFNALPKVSQDMNFTYTYKQFHKSVAFMQEKKTHIPAILKVQDTSLSFAAAAERSMPYIWLFGMVLTIGWLAYADCLLRRRLKKAGAFVPQSISLIFEDCKGRTNIRKTIKIMIQDAISTPAVFGLLRPRILLPPSILNLSGKEISYILLHELAHYKRKDLLANCLLLVLQAIHWFNPVIWYCFKKIRQDMEVAADERALALLEENEQKEYGKALLAVLEGFNSSKLAPRLLGMADDRKNIERRIRMIKMTQFFKSKRRMAIMIGSLCVAALSGILLTSGLTRSNVVPESAAYNAEVLLKYKTPYVGDNSKVVTLIDNLKYAGFRGSVSLQTRNTPYGITVDYDLSNADTDKEQVETAFRNNAAVLFSLIDNVDAVDFNINGKNGAAKYQYTRGELQEAFGKDLREYKKNSAEFQAFLNGFELNLLAYPEKYSMLMSSTPGIGILAQYSGTADKVRYSTVYGTLLTWDRTSGKISQYRKSAELPYGTPVYWSPLEDNPLPKITDKILVKAALLDKNNKPFAEKQLNIKSDDTAYYYVQPLPWVFIEQVQADGLLPEGS